MVGVEEVEEAVVEEDRAAVEEDRAVAGIRDHLVTTFFTAATVSPVTR